MADSSDRNSADGFENDPEYENGFDDEPELAGYEPHGRPLRSPRIVTAMRVVVVIGLVGLILPGILVTAMTAQRTAQATCASYVSVLAPESVALSVRFELVSPAGVGWNCYAIQFGGDSILVASLGLVPGPPRLPRTSVESS